jgi:streptomycin 6-kinase
VHPGLEWLRCVEGGPEWLDRLPLLVAECTELWSLELEEPFPYAFASFAVPAGDVVLKIQFPDRESTHEADALALLGGDGAVRLVAEDRGRRALLLERCRPGTPVIDLAPDAALEVIIGLLPRLWKPAGPPFRPLADEAAWWRESLEPQWERAGRPFERRLLDAGLEALRELPDSQGEQVLVNQDLNMRNVLAAEREPWLVIDPKPLAGEREFGVAALIRGGELKPGERDVRRRLDLLTSELGLDRERTRRWALAQTLAWAWVDDEPLAGHVDIARWLLQAE